MGETISWYKRGTGVIAAAITLSSLVYVVLPDKLLFSMHRKKWNQRKEYQLPYPIQEYFIIT